MISILQTNILLLMLASQTAFAQINLDEVDMNDLLNIKIESASKQSEPWSESPVPVSIITQEMIKLSGVRTVHEALILFVPGYTDAEDRNELNFAPRGIYATSQQKVLIMLNGHRINSRSYLTAMPDYGIAIHHLERIEILRGPGSSLYGNVALAGVINLITKKGKDADSTTGEVAAGNHDQRRLRFLTGSGTEDTDILAWGQFYQTPGESHKLNGNEKYNTGKTGSIRIDGVDNEPSHDFGVTYKKGSWSFLGASRRGQMIEPYGSANNAYEYGQYQTLSEAGPGLGMSHQHLGAKYETQLSNNWDFSFNPYYDRTEIEALVANNTGGGYWFGWADQDIGFITQGSRSYKTSGAEGTLLIGAQVDAFEVTDSQSFTLTNGDFSGVDNPLLEPGGEEIYSAFLQAKHNFNERMILNAGARYDFKNRRSGENYDKVSPRLAFIFLPDQTWEYKLSYSESFVDAPYWYRYNSGGAIGNLFGGSEALNPEVLRATQFQSVWKATDRRLRNAATLFYQKGEDIIVNRASAAGTPADPKYVNSGSIESMGVENELSWLENSYQLFWNFSYSRALSTRDYAKFDDQFAHIPTFTSSAVFNYLFTKDLSANLTVRYIGEQYFNRGTATAPSKATVDAATILNLGGRYENAFAAKGLFFDGRIYNLLETEHYQGGQSGTQIPFRQAGRWWLASIGYEF